MNYLINTLSDLKTMPYKEYLQTDHWKAMRNRQLKLANYKCQLCSNKENLNVHHNTYENRGEEKDEDLITLCKNCHGKFHDKQIINKKENTANNDDNDLGFDFEEYLKHKDLIENYYYKNKNYIKTILGNHKGFDIVGEEINNLFNKLFAKIIKDKHKFKTTDITLLISECNYGYRGRQQGNNLESLHILS